jgi:DNA-directed RNA polymerase specialized sigma24 family protein
VLKSRAALRRLSSLWSRLSARERLVLTLLFYEGLTATEAARTLGCTVREIERLVEARLSRFQSSMVPAAVAPARRRRARPSASLPRRWAA